MLLPDTLYSVQQMRRAFEDVLMLCTVIGFRTQQSLFFERLVEFQRCDVCSYMLFTSCMISRHFDKILF